MVKFFLFSFLSLSTFSAGADVIPCEPLVNKTLNSYNLGSFNHPRSGVEKTLAIVEGGYKFDVAGGPSILLTQKDITISSMCFGIHSVTTIAYDNKACKVTLVSQSGFSNLGPSFPLQVDQTVCNALAAKWSLAQHPASGQSISLNDTIVSGLCRDYFQEYKASINRDQNSNEKVVPQSSTTK